MKGVRLLALVLALALLWGSVPALAEEMLIQIPEAIRVIGAEAFCGDDSLGQVVLPKGISEIHSRAFADSSITRINLPSSLTYIADDVFEGCGNLEIDFEDGKWYGWALANGYVSDVSPVSDFEYTVDAKNQCVTINGYIGNDEVVYIPGEIEGYPVTEIGRNALRYNSVAEWILPDSIETIRTYAFADAQLKSIRLPENDCLVLESNCFINTKNLTELHLPEGLQDMQEYCFQNSGLEKVNIPSGIAELKFNTFAYCANLSEVTFAEGELEHLVTGCFQNSGISKIILPESLTRIDSNTFIGCGNGEKFEIWMGKALRSLPENSTESKETFPENTILYAPEGSYAAGWAVRYAKNGISYGGGGCAEMFGGEHDYEVASDTVLMDAESGLHSHKTVYECSRCLAQKTEEQSKLLPGCWRCEAKEAYGDGADIPADKFELLDRYRLGGESYYRIRLLSGYKGVEAGYEVLFMDEKLQMVVKRETINTLFKTHIYTGSGALPWEYTGTASDYPSLEKRSELIAGILANAEENLDLAKTFMELDMCYEKLGSTASAGLTLLWGDPAGALESLKKAVVPDMDALVTVMHITLMNKLAESMAHDAAHYTRSINEIVNDGFVVCEKAEESLQIYANCLAMRQLSVDNSSAIIDEIAACDGAFGVGVRNILNMLKGAVGVKDNPLAKTGVLVTQTIYTALTSADEAGEESSGLVLKFIGDLAGIVADAGKFSGLGAMVEVYKSGNFSLSEFMCVDKAMEKYENTYNAFCLKNTTPVYLAHDALAEN